MAFKGIDYKWKDRKIFVSQVNNLPEDRIIVMSDGVTQAGIGNNKYPLKVSIQYKDAEAESHIHPCRVLLQPFPLHALSSLQR